MPPAKTAGGWCYKTAALVHMQQKGEVDSLQWTLRRLQWHPGLRAALNDPCWLLADILDIHREPTLLNLTQLFTFWKFYIAIESRMFNRKTRYFIAIFDSYGSLPEDNGRIVVLDIGEL